jgi:hypothetical protein
MNRYLPVLPTREELRAKLEGSRIEQLLTAGPAEAASIHDYVRQPWRSIFLGHKPRDIEGITRLIALNLDWYLETPRPLLRKEWVINAIAAAIAVMGIVAFLALVFVMGDSFFTTYWGIPLNWIILIPVMVSTMTLSMPDTERHMLHVKALKDYLQDVFHLSEEQESDN